MFEYYLHLVQLKSKLRADLLIYKMNESSEFETFPEDISVNEDGKTSLKLLSTSSPTMTAQSQPLPPPSPKNIEKVPTTSKSRQMKFNRHFPTVESDEEVLNYYSCALIGDILLQGHLYITKNYFAFYSNVFGYVTKLLIPMLAVEQITKEKTARIIPNAVGISTAEEKHIFGSLMSRDNAYKYMVKVWEVSQKAMEEVIVEPDVFVEPEIGENAASESDSSETKGVDSEKESTATSQNSSFNIKKFKTHCDSHHNKTDSRHLYIRRKFIRCYRSFFNLPSQTLLLFAAISLLIMLFLSATLLLYRISKIHDKYISLLKDYDASTTGDDIYNHLLRFSINLHSKSTRSMHNFMDSNLHQIAKVRQDLEMLSSLLMPKDSSNDAKESHEKDFSVNNS
ncbi:hypothetical protein HHI36_016830 [Cryptolaemus montrouzieri]|uniref:GRAM domain-containing protein n=1 Tax=Cryptolaemus montrouzieri TaxID=559131 RepID=A0ABD2NKV6_9CUCU